LYFIHNGFHLYPIQIYRLFLTFILAYYSYISVAAAPVKPASAKVKSSLIGHMIVYMTPSLLMADSSP
jgi:hypothetical protein